MCNGDATTTDPVAEVVAAIERLWTRAKPSRSGIDSSLELRQLRRACDLLELAISRTAAEFAQTDAYEAMGSVSPLHWIRHNCQVSGGTASRYLCAGEQAEYLPNAVNAMHDGSIGFAHLGLIAQTFRGVIEANPDADFDEESLIHLAETHSVGRFRHDCSHIRHQADAQGFLKEHQESSLFRRLEIISCDGGGIAIRGLLDTVGGATLRTALEPLARPGGTGDTRDRKQRLADALVELAHHNLDVGAVPQVAGFKPHLQVTASIETLQGLPGAPAGEMEYSEPIPAATVQRLACDSSLTRILLNSQSAVIDVGRAQRIANSATRKALALRDRGCVWPGCERPPSWTAAHHLKHWANGGATNLDNLVLLCHRHHQLLHEDGWQLARGKDGNLVATPPILAHRSPYDRPIDLITAA